MADDDDLQRLRDDLMEQALEACVGDQADAASALFMACFTLLVGVVGPDRTVTAMQEMLDAAQGRLAN